MKSIPHSEEAEQGVLSSMMSGGNRTIAEVVQVVGETAGDFFFRPANGKIYDALVEWWHAGKAFDLMMFTKAMLDAKRAQDMGGAPHITTCYTFTQNASNLGMYLDGLKEKRWLRYVIAEASGLVRSAEYQQDDVAGILSAAETALARIVGRSHVHESPLTIHQIVNEVIDDLSEPEKVFGLSTGFPKLDALVGGLAPEAKIVVAGPISGGKSAFAQCLVASLAVERRIPTAVFTFEMSAKQTVKRVMQIRSGVSAGAVGRGEASMFDMNAFNKAATDIAESPLHIIKEQIDIAGIKARCMQLQPRIVVIDYLQIVPERKQKGENRTDQLDRMSAETKQLATQLGITVIELSQLTEKDGTFVTRGSKGITADADQLWVMEGADDESKPVIPKRIVVAKQRDGAKGSVEFSFRKAVTTFREK